MLAGEERGIIENTEERGIGRNPNRVALHVGGWGTDTQVLVRGKKAVLWHQIAKEVESCVVGVYKHVAHQILDTIGVARHDLFCWLEVLALVNVGTRTKNYFLSKETWHIFGVIVYRKCHRDFKQARWRRLQSPVDSGVRAVVKIFKIN